MPELPEVESVRRSLAKRVLGRTVCAVELRRGDVVEGDRSPAALLVGCVIHAIERHGKQLAILGSPIPGPEAGAGDGSFDRAAAVCVCVHLGMTGSLCHRAAASKSREPMAPRAVKPGETARHAKDKNKKTSDALHRGPQTGESLTPGSKPGEPLAPGSKANHIHVVWQLDDGSTIEFRDPRRFGGIWTFANPAALWKTRWQYLGKDALRITADQLLAKLSRTPRPIKAALLDQNLIAGLGNIYVDELLFAVGVHPLSRSYGLDRARVRAMAGRMKKLLGRAIQAGGSTLRDYVDANGDAGGFQKSHNVYGRAGKACVNCGTALELIVVGGRSTVFCSNCQTRLKKRLKTPSENR